jgi:hypothetical protein
MPSRLVHLAFVVSIAVVLFAACSSSDDGSKSCGPDSCGACPMSCPAVDKCVNGTWSCTCACPDAGDAAPGG